MGRSKNNIPEVTNEEWSEVSIVNRKMVEEFIKENVHLAKDTLTQYTSALRIYFRWVKDNIDNKPFYDIKSKDFLKYQNYLIRMDLSSSAIKLKRSVISSFNDYIETYYDDDYPMFRNYITKKIANIENNMVNKKEPLTLEEYRNLCDKLEKMEKWQWLALLKCLFSSGCRRGEVIQFLKEIVDYEPNIKTIKVKNENGEEEEKTSISYLTHEVRAKGKGKTGLVRKFQLSEEAIDAVKKWLEVRGEDDCPYIFVSKNKNTNTAHQIERGTVNKWFNKMEEIVGKHFTPHSTRRSRATSMVVEQGKDISVVQKLLGHRSSSTTEIYIVRKDTDASDEAFID